MGAVGRFVPGSEVAIHGSSLRAKGYQTRTTRFCGAIPRPIAGRLAIAYEDALAEIELANAFSAANAGPPTSPPEARQRPGTRGIVQRMERRRPSPFRTPMRRPERSRLPATRDRRALAAQEARAARSALRRKSNEPRK